MSPACLSYGSGGARSSFSYFSSRLEGSLCVPRTQSPSSADRMVHRDLPEPLLTYRFYQKWIDLGNQIANKGCLCWRLFCSSSVTHTRGAFACSLSLSRSLSLSLSLSAQHSSGWEGPLDDLVSQVKQLLMLLPEANRYVLQILFDLLHQVRASRCVP